MYNVIKTKIILEGQEEVTYGLKHADGTVMNDVSPNKTEVQRLADYFNEKRLASCHMENAVSDMIDRVQGYEI